MLLVRIKSRVWSHSSRPLKGTPWKRKVRIRRNVDPFLPLKNIHDDRPEEEREKETYGKLSDLTRDGGGQFARRGTSWKDCAPLKCAYFVWWKEGRGLDFQDPN